MFDTEKFIECVKHSGCLWDTQLGEYADKTQREQAWVDIGGIMHEDWEQIDLKERDLRVGEMKKKWRHLRDCFNRCLNQRKSGDASLSKKRKYVYTDSLMFLQTSINQRTHKNKQKLSQCQIKPLEKSEPEPKPQSQPLEKSEAEPKSQRQPLEKSEAEPKPQSQPLEKSKADPKPEAESDADKFFMLSLLPDYKKLDEEEKIDFRIHALQFFREATRRRRDKATVPNYTPSTPNQT